MLTRGRRYHLAGPTSSPGHFVYLELDRAVVNIGQARISLRSVAEKVVVGGL